MDNLTRPHILLPNAPESLQFTSKSARGSNPSYPERNRVPHGEWLQNRFEQIWQESVVISDDRRAASVPGRNGVYVEFAGQPGSPLKTQSLEDKKSGIRLLNIRKKEVDGELVNYATIFIPSEKRNVFLKKFRDYTLNDTPKGIPKNQDLAAGIEQMQRAILTSFWVDSDELMPGDFPVWCEIWLRIENSENVENLIESFFDVCTILGINYKRQQIGFPERLVTIIQTNHQRLGELIESFDYVAEIRRAQEPESFWTSQYNSEQTEWVEELLTRVNVIDGSKVFVTILDTGVNNGHPLLSPVLSEEDCHTVVPDWNKSDVLGHGTLMAGICSYGNLKKALESGTLVELISRLESLKILPNEGKNDPDLYGYLTSQGISLAEIQNPQAKRIICLAVTSPYQTDKGRPSSWSAAIDAISSGADDDQRRLFVISAGNIRNPQDLIKYYDSNRKISIESPAQAWNALTVGGYTRKSFAQEADYDGYKMLASPGTLSPFSTTSLTWELKKWPNKPDIILEGGNLLKSPKGEIENSDDLAELTTFHQPLRKHFSTLNGTSLATAKATWMASVIQFYYPNFWPETIRGLMVHSAEWTNELLAQFEINLSSKTDVARILRIAGYGVPDLKKALQCASNSLTLVAQNSIQPFIREGANYKTNEMHLYRLPWPLEELRNLGEVQVKLKITLSFFIEPGPGEIGWKDRYRYSSHGLRFDLNNTNETENDFKRRLNKAANTDEDEIIGGTSGSERWIIGKNNRKQGSLHSDTWIGNAADLAACNIIGVYPIIGWWRERHYLGCFNKQTRYTLIVSLEAPESEVDIYTTVRNMVAVPVEIQV
ncbi:MAG TPA: peptidase S8 [Prolixibacteraceae bacterium]|nr:peptidase S8 [Prolixibacteraceae bacterium]